MSLNTEVSPPANVFPHAASDPAYIRAERIALGIERGFLEVWSFLRFLLFFVYLLFGILNFWLWIVAFALGLLRLGLRMMMATLLFLSGGSAPRHHGPAENPVAAIDRELKFLWASRLVAYENVARPVARHWLAAQTAVRTFWHWGMARKASALLMAALFVGAPMSWVIPRPNYVQITDDNAVHYEDDGSKKVTYLVHATDLKTRGKTREYRNEDMWWLGKINSQGLKSQLQPGRNYKLWIVGIRWYYMPRLFPNIISAEELDETGAVITDPSRLMQSTQTPSAPR
jgi:hypothetical protein